MFRAVCCGIRWGGHKGCLHLWNARADLKLVQQPNPSRNGFSEHLILIQSRRGNPRLRLVRNGRVLTDKAKRRLRGDRQPVHRIRSAAAQLDRRSRSGPRRASCRCLVRQQTLHRAATLLSPPASRATGQVPKDCQACSQAESRSALRCSGRRSGREKPQPISLRLVCGCAVGQGLSARAAGRERARHESRGVV